MRSLTGLINLEQKSHTLSSRLLQLNTEFTNAQADRMRKKTPYQIREERLIGGAAEAAGGAVAGAAFSLAAPLTHLHSHSAPSSMPGTPSAAPDYLEI
jgi:hypothetical protein